MGINKNFVEPYSLGPTVLYTHLTKHPSFNPLEHITVILSMCTSYKNVRRCKERKKERKKEKKLTEKEISH